MPTDLIKVKDTRYQNECTGCGKPIPAHSQSLWDKQNNKNYHPGCEPHANPTARPANQSISPVAVVSKTGLAAKHAAMPVPAPLTDKERVDMVAQAQQEVKLIFGLDNSASEYATYVSMLFHARLQAQQQAFELALSRYIQAKKLGNIEKVQQAKGL